MIWVALFLRFSDNEDLLQRDEVLESWKAGVLQTSRQGGREAELYICKILIWSIEISVSNIMCGAKFEFNLNDVRFVGHPVLLELDTSCESD